MQHLTHKDNPVEVGHRPNIVGILIGGGIEPAVPVGHALLHQAAELLPILQQTKANIN